MKAEAVKDALRRRHPAVDGTLVGPWTCLEEYRGIDLLAVSAWSSLGYRRIGYEVKVSRSDLRRELLKPGKRERNVRWCHEFYLAVPAGLLTGEEITWQEPVWAADDFKRERCPELCSRPHRRGSGKRGREVRIEIPEAERDPGRQWLTHRYEWRDCARCGGLGYLDKSRAEREAPNVWVPRDVGLVVVYEGSTKVVKQAPRRRASPEERAIDAMVGDLVRWASVRPDPRHVAAFLRLTDAYMQQALRELPAT